MNRTIHFFSTSRTVLILLLATLLTATAAQTAGAQETSTITVGGTDYTLFTGFTATGGNGTNYAKLVDGNTSTDWIATKSNHFNGGTADPAFVEFHADEPIVPKGYVLTCHDEDAGFWKPVEWALKAKLNEGDGWTTIHSSTTTLGQGKTFEIACDNDDNNEYQYFRFEVYEVGTTNVLRLDELQFYGLLPAYTHLTVKAATCMATGIKQDCYRRNSDGKYFTDNTGTTELQESDVIAPIIPHTGEHHEATDVNIEYWQCSMCGKYFSDSGYTTEITEEQTKIYRTITIDGSISGLVTCYDSPTLAGETVYLYVSDLIDASTLKVNDGAVELTAVTDIQYAFTMPAADVTVTAEVAQSNADGDILTGSIRHTVTITNGANITLSDATITGSIVCEGSATITLVGTNSVSGASQKAGIQIGGSGTTLTIKGDGSLTANGGNQSAGIGLSRAWDPANDVISGDIVIEGGNITANGGSQWGAGIGTGVIYGNGSAKTARIGDITIKGGTVKATGGTSADGIGTGYTYSPCTNAIGTVTIYDGIDKVDASSIKDFGSVVYMHDENNVTASKTDYFTIAEDGDRRVITPKDDTDYTITIADDIEHGTLTGAATAKYMETVNITVTPDLGYWLSRLVVKDADNNDVATTGNTFQMPKGNVTVSAVFEQGTHGTTEFAWGYFGQDGFVTEATIYDGVTTVNLQTGKSYQILKYDDGYSYRKFLLDNSTYGATIPYSGGTGTFPEYGNGTNFNLNDESGFYDITMTDVGNGKWSVSILKTVAVMDAVPDQTYTGSEITPEPLVLVGSLSLTKGTDYEYSYTNNTNIGTATVTVTFKGDYASLGSVEKTFTIVKATPTVTAPTPIENLVYSGTAQALVTAGTTDFGTLLYSLDGTNYSADIPTATNAGNYTVYYKVEASGNWNAVDAQTISVAITYYDASLADNGDNADAISNIITNYGSKADVTLQGRTLTKSGEWNTLCLPFDVTTLDGTPLEGATIKELDAANSNLAADGTLTLKFAEATSIEAGKPYIVKWTTTGENISNPVFEGVTITATAPVAVVFANNATAGPCQFVGQFSPFTIVESGATDDNQGNKNEIILMGAGSKLGYSKAARTLKCFRAHFYVPANDGAGARSFVLDFGDRMATSISEELRVESEDEKFATATGWYTLDGHKLNGRPTAKGVYIVNGKKVVIK